VGKYEKDDVVFDSSRERDKPLELQLGKHAMGKGVDVGLADMCEGKKSSNHLLHQDQWWI